MVNTIDVSKPEQLSDDNNAVFKDIPEWLTEDLFAEFLQKDFPNYEKITKFIIKLAVSAGENYMTVMLRAIIEVTLPDQTTKSTSYMIKIKPTPETLQTMIKEWQIFTKEHTSYTTYIPKFEEYYHKAGVDVRLAPRILIPSKLDINDDLLILEDLGLKGFKNVNRHVGLDMEHTKAVLRKLAQFHAASARYVETEGEFPTIYDQCLLCEKDMFVEHRLNTDKIFRENLHLYGDLKHLEGKLKHFAETQNDPYQMQPERNPDGFNVLNHGDLWANNIMFQYNDDGSLNDTYFIDFQLSRYGSPAQDLIYFLLSSTNLEIKLQHFDYFISYYHKHLIENLKLVNYEGKIPKLRDIHMDLFKYDYWTYTVATGLMPIVICEARADASIDTLLGDEGDNFRHAMYRNSNFAANMRVVLPWLDNRGAFDL